MGALSEGMGSRHTTFYPLNPHAHTDGRFISFRVAYSLPRMTAQESPPIIAIDDDIEHLAYVAALLTRAGYRCVSFTSARDAIAYLEKNRAELVITDIFMPDMDGFELLNTIRRAFPDVTVITLSGEGRITKDFYLECAKHLGAVASFRKPLDPQALRAIVAQYLPRSDAVTTNRNPNATAANEH